MMRLLPFFAVLLAASLVSGRPASAQQGESELPALSAVFDSAAVVAALGGITGVPSLKRPAFRVDLNEQGAIDTVAAVTELPTAYTAAVRAVLTAHARPLATGTRGPATLYVLAQTGSTPLFEELVSKQRKPELRNAREVGRRLGSLIAERIQQRNEWAERTGQSREAAAEMFPTPNLSTIISLRLLPDGSVGEIRLRPSSGQALLDRQITDIVRRMRFTPATVDGVPVPVWVIIPLNLGDPRA